MTVSLSSTRITSEDQGNPSTTAAATTKPCSRPRRLAVVGRSINSVRAGICGLTRPGSGRAAACLLEGMRSTAVVMKT